jgi:hypothetical protein
MSLQDLALILVSPAGGYKPAARKAGDACAVSSWRERWQELPGL